MKRYGLRMDRDGRELVIHHYLAFDIKPEGVHCEECQLKLDQIECVQITAKGRTSGPWFCDDHVPFEVMKEQ